MDWALYIPSKIYTNREDVPRTEEPELLSDESKFSYIDLENKHGMSGEGIEYIKYTRVIETKAPIIFRAGDAIKFFDTGVQLKIKDVQPIIPKEKQKSIDLWGSKFKILKSVKRISLQ